MIPTILFLILRRFKRTNPEQARKIAGSLGKIIKVVMLMVLLILVFNLALPSHSR